MRRFKGLDAFALKLIAICAMVIDHVSEGFDVPGATGQALRLIGRLTAPIMFWSVAQGYAHTRDVKKYLSRLLLFAVISHVPFLLFEGYASIGRSGISIPLYPTSVIWTLAMGLMAIWAYDKIKNPAIKVIAVLCAMALAYKSDWGFFGVILCLSFWVFRQSKAKTAAAVCFVTALRILYAFLIYGDGNILHHLSGQWFQIGLLLCLPVIFASNGERGIKTWKYTFYVFYPAHLLMLCALLRYL